MALWDAHGVSAALRDAAREQGWRGAGRRLGGRLLDYEGCVTDSFGEARAWRGGLGMLPGSFCPHFDGEGAARPRLHPGCRRR